MTGPVLKKGPPRYIAVEGVIGVGKTTLVNRLAEHLDARTVFEEFEQNPFLPDFYRDRDAFAFSTQIFFLMSRFRQQERLAQGDLFRRCTLSDYCFEKDRIFAYLTLKDHELRLYEQLFEVLSLQVFPPDLIIWLHADQEVILERINRRGRPYELNMDPGYIRDLASAYTDFFKSYQQVPVLRIDTSEVDLRNDSASMNRLLEAVKEGKTSVVFERPGEPEAAATLELPFR